MSIARQVATRSTCLRRRVGCVIVLEKRIVSTGYNGAPSGMSHCEETGCVRRDRGIASGERHELCRGLHAEQNAIIQAALHGVSVSGGTMYVTHQPCITCAKMIINAGIRRVVCAQSFPDELARSFLAEAGVALVLWHPEEQGGTAAAQERGERNT